MTKQEIKEQISALFDEALLAGEATALDAQRFVSFVDAGPEAFKEILKEDSVFYTKAAFFKVLLMAGSDKNRAKMAEAGILYQPKQGLGGN